MRAGARSERLGACARGRKGASSRSFSRSARSSPRAAARPRAHGAAGRGPDARRRRHRHEHRRRAGAPLPPRPPRRRCARGGGLGHRHRRLSGGRAQRAGSPGLRGPWRRAGGLRPRRTCSRAPTGSPPELRARADELFGLKLPAAPRGRIGDAVEVLRRGIESADGKVTVLSLAPMTDTALLLRSDRDLRDRIASIVAMGGAAAVPGNIGPGHERSEWNLWIDPVAAREVLGSGDRLDHPRRPRRHERRAGHRRPLGTCSIVTMPALAPGRRPGPTARAGMFAGAQYLWHLLAAAAVVRPDVLTFTLQARERRDDRRRRWGAWSCRSARRARPSRARRRPCRVRAPVPDGADRTDALPRSRRPAGARSCAAPTAAARTGYCDAPRRARGPSTPSTTPRARSPT